MSDIRDPSVYEPDDPDENGSREDVIGALPGLARLTVGAWARTADWSLRASVRTGARIVNAAVTRQSPTDLAADLSRDAREYARALFGVDASEIKHAAEEGLDPEDEEEVEEAAAAAEAVTPDADREDLRRMGAELLARSADLSIDDDTHPAFARILTELAPDEARILRLLALDGPQAAVDVRASKTLNISSELVAPGLNMIGAQAGCRHVQRVPAYLNNLERLGLIWFSREPLPNPLEYQVLEAQPEVIEAMKGSGRGKTVRRSIYLTPFGSGFCELCLPLEEDAE
jgi:Abortive infection alpha